jgi:hypothetical protein
MPRKTQMPTNYFLKNHTKGIEKHKGKLNVHKRSWEHAKEGLKHTRGNQMCAKRSWEHIREN